MARRTIARPLPAWVGDLPVFERTLPNGFRVLVLPRTHAPVVVSDLYYPVGSFDEPAGKTGLAHFVEHMPFKGTERFPKGQIDRLAFVAAGHSNAETGEDATHYLFAFPSDRWELALAVEADRMRGATFDPSEVEAERHVIVEERARDQDSPAGRLDQTHLALAYLHHPYRNPILGWPDDLERITVEDLRSLYERHYRPDGAVLVVVGDVAMVGVPGEFFTVLGREIKLRSPYRDTFVFELANDYVGYLPDARAFERGGYQTWTGLHSFVEQGSGETIVGEAVKLLTQLHEGTSPKRD